MKSSESLGWSEGVGRPPMGVTKEEMLQVEVRLYATLRKYGPPGGEPSLVTLPSGATVALALETLKIPEDVAKVILVNGRHASPSDTLHQGDRLVLFPPVEGG
jgi:molybdopterin converting factor small subunit